ncbi:transposase [Dictyobacter alpinus]|uniref:Transposase n=1 Tax=Dictyobacter alpinus TaxID=2014873 RepID=A0A402BDC7_9CHLR|nr:IS3 family transposase [Dictyobacter alpinus]GCE29277.1 transposase [Dictyobacter alpinus]
MTYQFIAVAQSEYPVTRLCDILEVSVSGYYAWRRRPQSHHTREDGELRQAIEDVYKASQQRYGSPRVYAELRAQGSRCSRKRVARLMREQNLCARKKRHRVQTTRQDPTHPKTENVLDQDVHATAPNQKWVVDVTMFQTQEGPLFLAGVLDLFSRSLVGWALASEQDTLLVEKALRMALLRRHPSDGLLHHWDRGSQYTSKNYRDLLEREGMIVSMSRTGNCYDNAAMESSGARSSGNASLGLVFRPMLSHEQPSLSMWKRSTIVNAVILL